MASPRDDAMCGTLDGMELGQKLTMSKFSQYTVFSMVPSCRDKKRLFVENTVFVQR
jgi:hypothetical protein